MSSPNITMPSQPTYGEGLGESLKAQMQMLTGRDIGADEGFEELYRGALGRGGGTYADIMREVETPLRLQAAQTETDVLRRQLLGEEHRARRVTDADVAANMATEKQLGDIALMRDGRLMVADESVEAAPGTFGRIGGEIYNFDIGGDPVNQLQYMVDQGYMKSGDPARIDRQQFYYLTPEGEKAGFGEHFVEMTGHDQKLLVVNPDGDMVTFDDTVNEGYEPVDFTAEIFDELRGQAEVPAEDFGLKLTYYDPSVPPDSGLANTEGYDAVGRKTLEEGKTYRTSGGLLDIYGPKGMAEYDPETGQRVYDADEKGAYKQAGFATEADVVAGRADSVGEFMGLATAGMETVADAARRQRAADIGDVERLGQRATDAYREQGGIQTALDRMTALTRDPSERDAIGMPSTAAYVPPVAPPPVTPAPETAGGSGDVLREFLAGYRPEAPTFQVRPTDTPVYGDALPREGELVERPNYQDNVAAYQAYQAGGGTLDQNQWLAGQTAGGYPDAAGRRRRERVGSEIVDEGTGLAAAQPATAGLPIDSGVPTANLTAPPVGGPLQTLASQMGTGGDFGAIRGELSRQALSDLTLGGQLSDRQLRDAVEQARQWATATGRQFDQAAVIRELQARQQASGQEEARRRAFAGQVLSGEAGLQGRELGAAESDVERELRRRFMEQQAEQHALTQERAYAGQLLGAEQATSADPFQAILGRPSGAGPALGQQQFAGGMALGAQAGPQYLNPEAGLGFIQNQAANQASMYGAQVGADAAATAAKYGMVGDIASSIIGLKKPTG